MYTRVESRFWQDEKMRNVSDDARYLMLYLLTSPHRNILGFYFLPFPYACFDLGWDEKRFKKALEELLNTGGIAYDAISHVVLVKNYLKHNPLENPNQVKSAIVKLDELPETHLFQSFLTIIKQSDKPFIQPLIERLQERLGQPGTGTGTGSETGSGSETETEEPECMHGAEAAPCQPTAPPIIALTLNDKTEYPVTEEQVEEWTKLYPAVDVMQELRKMKGWLDANPSKRKTKKGILRFINNWLSKEQDRGGYKARPSPPAFKNYDDEEDFLKG